MEKPRLRGLKSLFGRANKPQSEPSSPPVTKHAQALPTRPSEPLARPEATLPEPLIPATQDQASDQTSQAERPKLPTVKKPADQLALTFFGISDPGLKRPNNEDHFIVADLTRQKIAVEDNVLVPEVMHQPLGPKGTLLAVADGLGGHDDGEIASHIAVEAIVQTSFIMHQEGMSATELLTLATHEAHNAICRYTATIPGSRSMSSTLTAMHIDQGVMTIAQVGDSRAYLFSNGTLTQLTEDQTIVQMMLKKGMLTDEEAQNHPDQHVILQALGQGRAVSPEVTNAPIGPDDCILLCSDGLSSYVEHQHIENILNEEPDEQSRCKRLLEAAYAAGGEDNVTILIARLQLKPAP